MWLSVLTAWHSAATRTPSEFREEAFADKSSRASMKRAEKCWEEAKLDDDLLLRQQQLAVVQDMGRSLPPPPPPTQQDTADLLRQMEGICKAHLGDFRDQVARRLLSMETEFRDLIIEVRGVVDDKISYSAVIVSTNGCCAGMQTVRACKVRLTT